MHHLLPYWSRFCVYESRRKRYKDATPIPSGLSHCINCICKCQINLGPHPPRTSGVGYPVDPWVDRGGPLRSVVGWPVWTIPPRSCNLSSFTYLSRLVHREIAWRFHADDSLPPQTRREGKNDSAQMASPQSPGGAALASGGGGVYKRASRKGAPRRFTCDYPACDKIYSRAEHLQRHQLNRR